MPKLNKRTKNFMREDGAVLDIPLTEWPLTGPEGELGGRQSGADGGS